MIEKSAEKPTMLFIIVMGALSAFGPLAIDMYLPALPTVKEELQATTSATQLTLTFFMIGLAVGNIIAGTLSDSIGRKKPLVVAMVLFTLSSIFCAIAPNVEVMMLARFIQGMSGGAGVVISRAIASDLYRGNALTKFMATLMLVNGAAPVLAPVIGGVILTFTTWRVMFFILMAFGILMLIGSIVQIKESLPVEARSKASFRTIFNDYRLLLTTPTFIVPALIQGTTFAVFFGYLSASPFIIQNIYGYTPQQYSYIFAGLACGLIVMAQLTGKLVDYIHPQKLLRIFTAIQVVGAVLTIIGLSQHLPIAFIIFSLLLVVAPVAGVGSVGFSIAMTNQKRGGSAASFLGLLQYAIGGVASALVGVKGDANATPYMIILAVASVLLIILHIINYRVFKK